MTTRKTCTKCKQDKELTEFYKDRRIKDGLRSQCKSCMKGYHETNREKITARQKAHYQANREKIIARQQAHYQANREKVSVYKRAHYEAHREEVRSRQHAYYQENSEILKERSAQYKRDRLANDPTFRQVGNIRSNLRGILHGRGAHQPTLELLGCTGQEWRDHLESQFTEGMSWDSYGKGDGKWEIDHILPVSSFDQTDPEQRKICWHYSNTQPLWHTENVLKGNSIPTE